MPNPGVTTLAAIRTAAKSRADMVNSSFVADSEWLEYINGSYFELYDLLIQKFGADYYVAVPYSFTTDGVNDRFALPDGSASAPAFYKLLGLEVQIDSKHWTDVDRFNFAERNWGGTPDAGLVMQAWYAPRLTVLAADGDLVDGVSGWEDYIKVDAAIKALAKEESDTTVQERAKAALKQRIEEAAENRDESRPQTVVDVRSGSRRRELRYKLVGNQVMLRSGGTGDCVTGGWPW